MVKSKKRASSNIKIKSSYLWMYFLAFGIIIIALIFFAFLDKGGIKIIDNNYTKIDLSSDIQLLEKCLEVSGVPLSERSADLKYCPVINKDILDKLKLIDGVSGKIVCDSFGKQDNLESYRRCFSVTRGCYLKFIYVKSIPEQMNKVMYQIYECKDKQYYTYSHTSPAQIRYMELHLSNETMELIKN